MNARQIPFVVCCLALGGCAGVTVQGTKEDDSYGPTGGVPFYVKQAVLVHETVVRTAQLNVSFEFADSLDGKATETLPRSGPVVVPKNSANEALVAALGTGYNDTGTTKSQIRAQLTSELNDLSTKKAGSAEERIASNTWKFDTVLSPTRHYITTKTPLFGSATSEYDLASDGTLSKVSSTITDNTAQTLLSLVPISSLLSRQWGLNNPAGGAAPKGKAPKPIFVRLVVVEVPTLYTLRKISPLKNKDSLSSLSGCGSTCTPLVLANALLGQGDTQLVSTATGGGDASKNDQSAYKISGTVTLPPPAK